MRAATVAWLVLSRLPRSILIATVTGWVLMVGANVAPAMPDLCLSAATYRQEIVARTAATLESADLVLGIGSWLAMLIAMMPPLLSSPLQHVWRQSLSRRRWRAAGLFLCAYVFGWLVAGGLLISCAVLAEALLIETRFDPIVVAVVIALAWQATPLKQLALNRCHHRPPLTVFGANAELDAFRFGCERAFWCVGTCWAFMLCTLLSNNVLHWAVMAAAMSVSLFERTREPQAPAWFSALGRPSSSAVRRPIGRGAS